MGHNGSTESQVGSEHDNDNDDVSVMKRQESNASNSHVRQVRPRGASNNHKDANYKQYLQRTIPRASPELTSPGPPATLSAMPMPSAGMLHHAPVVSSINPVYSMSGRGKKKNRNININNLTISGGTEKVRANTRTSLDLRRLSVKFGSLLKRSRESAKPEVSARTQYSQRFRPSFNFSKFGAGIPIDPDMDVSHYTDTPARAENFAKIRRNLFETAERHGRIIKQRNDLAGDPNRGTDISAASYATNTNEGSTLRSDTAFSSATPSQFRRHTPHPPNVHDEPASRAVFPTVDPMSTVLRFSMPNGSSSSTLTSIISKELPGYNVVKDIRSDKFSALSMSTEEQKNAVVDMILCSLVDGDVIMTWKLFEEPGGETPMRASKTSSTNALNSAISKNTSARWRPKNNIASGLSKIKSRAAAGIGASRSRNMKKVKSKRNFTWGSGAHSPMAGSQPDINEDVFPFKAKSRTQTYRTTSTGELIDELDIITMISSEIKEYVVSFVDEVERHYTETKYHGFHHALDVTQMMFCLIPFVRSSLKPSDRFLLLVSCLCHDLGHFGTNNKFLLSDFKDDMSASEKNEFLFLRKFGRKSPLETFHISTMKKIMSKSMLFSKDLMIDACRKKFFELSEQIILGTDMDYHVDYMTRIETEINKKLSEDSLESREMSLEIMIFLIKLSDLANLSREFEDAKEWAVLLSMEFEAMGTYKDSPYYESILKDNKQKMAGNIEPGADPSLFMISRDLTSHCLIEHQKKLEQPDISECGKMTSHFIATIMHPMLKLFSKVQKQGAWWLSGRLGENLQRWEILMKEKKLEKIILDKALSGVKSDSEVRQSTQAESKTFDGTELSGSDNLSV